MLLEIDRLRVVYPNGAEALRSLSFGADAGEIVAVIGRSGAGKSTLLRAINAMQPVAGGSVRIRGTNPHALPEAELKRLRRSIGVIWQDHGLVDRLGVFTNILTGRLGYIHPLHGALGYFNRAHREAALRNLKRLNLARLARSRCDRISGGERQRVAIARALSQEPLLLLADEPVCSLDRELSWRVLEDLARLAREDGVLTLMNLHQVEMAKAFAGRVIGIAGGEVVFDGPPALLDGAALDRIYLRDEPGRGVYGRAAG